MSATFEWKILRIECYPQSEEQVNVVTKIYWECVGTQLHNNATYIERLERNTELQPYVKGDPFIPYEQLTEAQVFNWVWSDYSQTVKGQNGNPDTVITRKELVENEIQHSIDMKTIPPTIFNPLPW